MAKISEHVWLHPVIVRQQMRELNLTQEQVATSIGTSKRSIERMLSTDNPYPTSDELVELLAPVLNIEPSVISLRQKPRFVEVKGNAPQLRREYIGREKDEEIVLRMLQPGIVVAVRGFAGGGKTTFAAHLAHHQQTASRFPDGVLWASVGPKPVVRDVLESWCSVLGFHTLQGETDETVSGILTGALRKLSILLVLDDVWKKEHIRLLTIGGGNCGTILTTRIRDLAEDLASGGNVHYLDVLDESSSLELLDQLTRPRHSSFCRLRREAYRPLQNARTETRVSTTWTPSCRTILAEEDGIRTAHPP